MKGRFDPRRGFYISLSCAGGLSAFFALGAVLGLGIDTGAAILRLATLWLVALAFGIIFALSRSHQRWASPRPADRPAGRSAPSAVEVEASTKQSWPERLHLVRLVVTAVYLTAVLAAIQASWSDPIYMWIVIALIVAGVALMTYDVTRRRAASKRQRDHPYPPVAR